MGLDDSGTLADLKAHRRELIDPKIAGYGGRIVKTTGDGLLVEFPSVVDAVRCAVDVQRGMAERNAGVPPDQRIDFRIGINVGDVIIDGDDIYGDGVNVAARLQTLAKPGAICVSRVVRDQLLDKFSFKFEDLGAQKVKNIARPVEVYRVDVLATAPRRFGRFELRPSERVLLADGVPVTIDARAFDLLVALADRPGVLITKDELLATVWPGLVVEENNLQVQVSALRKVLGQAAIATIPGRGYRFTPMLEHAEAVPSTATAEMPPLYGRSEDLSALRKLVEQHALVTVVGSGGIGKTRLAEEVAHDLGDNFVDGVRLVELAPLVDPALVAVTVARTLGLVVGDPSTALDLTVQALADQRVLLVMDSCEHLLEEVDRVVGALHKGAPGIHVLATSQELLRHPDEHVYRLGTLALPAEVTLASAREAGAIQLFAARVQAFEPRFLVSDSNVDAVVDICGRLDGIPLALELAAARVPLLGVDGVRDRLDQRFRMLTAGSRLALRRHQTLRAALEWSYSLLSEPEQIVFDRLGMFAGGFSLQSAQKLAADDVIDEWAVLDHLGAVVDKSLVLVGGGNAPRYRMLETTRAFALERLADRGATQQMLRRHAEVVLDLFELVYRDNLGGTPPGVQVARLAPDLDNMRGAMHWATEESGDRRIAIALIGAAGAGRGFLSNAGLQWEGRHWCEALKPLVDDTVPAADAARFWLACAEQGIAGLLSVAIADGQRAVSLYREAHDRLGMYLAWDGLIYSLTLAGKLEDARQAFDEARKLRDPSWPPRLRGLLENVGGLLFAEIGLPGEARTHLIEYLNLSWETGSESDELSALGLLVDLDVAAGHPDRAVEAAREPLARLRTIATGVENGLLLRNIATALMEAGQLDEAESVFREAWPLTRRAYGSAAFVLDDMAALLARRGRLDDAARVSAYAERVYAAKERTPRLVARRNRERLLALLSTERSPEALAQLYDEGRRLTEDRACALAFPTLARSG